MTTRARVAAELRECFDRFTAISEHATRACMTGDHQAFEDSLDVRDGLATRCRELAAILDTSDRWGVGAALLAPVHDAARRATEAHEQLLHVTQQLRLELGRQIDQLRQESGASAAYADPSLRSTGSYQAVR